jgi:small-conductance mechanosensitive channel
MDMFEWLSSLEGTSQRLFFIILIIVITIVTVNIVNIIIKRSFNRSSKYLKVDPTHYSFLRHSIAAIIYIFGFIAIIYTIPTLRTLSVTLLASAGVLAVVVGFASQQAFSNIISGVFIVIFKPFRVGDIVSIGTDVEGTIEDITLRHTVVKDFKNRRVIIPNTLISNEKIINASLQDERICKWVEFGITYESDFEKAKKIMQKEAEKHPLCIDKRKPEDKEKGDPLVRVRVIRFTDSAIILRANVWTKNSTDAWVLGCDLNELVKKRFDKAGIDLAYPHTTVVMKNNYKAEKKARKEAV